MQKKKWKSAYFWILIVIAGIIILYYSTSNTSKDSEISYSQSTDTKINR